MSSLQIEPAVGDSYGKVLDGSAAWAVYSVAGSSLKLQEASNEPLDELCDWFDEGKLMFAFCRVKEPVSGLDKFVLITWCGEGVPVSKKGAFNAQCQTVARFLKGFHVQINARDEADVTPAKIIQKVKDSSGAKYSIHQETATSGPTPAPKPSQKPYGGKAAPPPPKPAPFAASYKPAPKPPRTSPVVAAKPVFAPPAAASPYAPKPAPSFSKPSHPPPKSAAPNPGLFSSGSPQGAVSPDRSRYEAEMREKEAREHAMSGAGMREERMRQEAEERAREKAKYEQEMADKQAFEQRGDSMRLERQQREAEEQARERARQSAHVPASDPSAGLSVREERLRREAEERAREALEIQRKEDEYYNESKRAQELVDNRSPTPEFERAATISATTEVKFNRPTPKTSVIPEAFRNTTGSAIAPAAPSYTSTAPKSTSSFAKSASMFSQASAPPAAPRPGMSAAAPPPAAPRPGMSAAAPPPTAPRPGMSAAAPPPAAPRPAASSAPAPPPSASTGTTARALYDYDADESNELTLRVGDVITRIERVDPDWWQGENHQGWSGLFPASYVEVVADEAGSTVPVPPGAPPTVPRDDGRREKEERRAREEEEKRVEDERRRRAEEEEVRQRRSEEERMRREEEEEKRAAARREEDARRQRDEDAARRQREEDAARSAPPPPPAAGPASMQARALYSYTADESNEISFVEDELITGIEQVDTDWWSGLNSQGQQGLFPANYVEVIPSGDSRGGGSVPLIPSRPAPSAPAGITAIALYDYAADESNEVDLMSGATVTDIECVSEDWWQGTCNGRTGLFPAAYVERQ